MYKIYRIEEVKEENKIVKVKCKSVRIVMSILQVFMTD